MTVTSGVDVTVGVVRETVVVESVVVRAARLVQDILRAGNVLNLRRIRRLRLTGRAYRMTGSAGRGVTGAVWPWRSPGRARPRHAIHASERNRCNA
jgi:hypothetical protein